MTDIAFPIRAILLAALVLGLAGCTGSGDLQSCFLDRVADGDSIDLVCDGEKIKTRLHCIDAPELSQRPWGKQSQRYLESITPAQIMMRAIDTDRYGRTVAELFGPGADARSLNQSMVMAGQAAVYRRYCDDAEYLQLEAQARDYRIGIWSKPGSQQKPWQYRHGHPRQ